MGLPRSQYCRGAVAPLAVGVPLVLVGKAGSQAPPDPLGLMKLQAPSTCWERCPRESRGRDGGAVTPTVQPVGGEAGAGPRPPGAGLCSDSLPQGGCHRLAESPLGDHRTSLMPQGLALTLDACPGGRAGWMESTQRVPGFCPSFCAKQNERPLPASWRPPAPPPSRAGPRLSGAPGPPAPRELLAQSRCPEGAE